MKNVYYIKEDKSAVQDYYVDIIGKSLSAIGYQKYEIISMKEVYRLSKEDYFICISHYIVMRMVFHRFKNLIYWVQGLSPDESFMRNHSYIRKGIISCIELFALSKAKFVFMVSDGMLNHFKKKYHKDYSYKTYIMPCYNSELQKERFMIPQKYENNTFCYVGGLSVWQCFPETVAIYKQLEKKIPNAKFMVFTGDQDKAKSIIEFYGLKNYEIKYVKPDLLVNELANCKYGFIIRAESPVNSVATPTKLSNYMAAGLIPIVSDTVSFFKDILGQSEHAVVLNGINDIDNIIKVVSKQITVETIYSDYHNLFKRFYNNDTHIKHIATALKAKGL